MNPLPVWWDVDNQSIWTKSYYRNSKKQKKEDGNNQLKHRPCYKCAVTRKAMTKYSSSMCTNDGYVMSQAYNVVQLSLLSVISVNPTQKVIRDLSKMFHWRNIAHYSKMPLLDMLIHVQKANMFQPIE